MLGYLNSLRMAFTRDLYKEHKVGQVQSLDRNHLPNGCHEGYHAATG